MTKILSGDEIAGHLGTKCSGHIEACGEDYIAIHPDGLLDVAKRLKVHGSLKFEYLNAVSAVDFIEYFEIVYHLTSFEHNHMAVIKVKLYGRENPSIHSLTDVWRGADFQEREIWDLMGIHFVGHPNHKRIMLWEGFPGHPLRKDFKDTVVY